MLAKQVWNERLVVSGLVEIVGAVEVCSVIEVCGVVVAGR